MAFDLSGAHVGRYNRLYVLKGVGAYNVVSTLGGGGRGSFTELVIRFSSVGTALPHQADTSAVVGLNINVIQQAEQTALNAWPASSINNQAIRALTRSSDVLHIL